MPYTNKPFDAVLLISFGGPSGPNDIRPFLGNVLRARRIPESRFESVVKHYEKYGGVSPLTEITSRQAIGLQERLVTSGYPLPIYVGMRNWHPFLEDTLDDMRRHDHKQVLAVTLAAHHCYSSCGQYKQNITQARESIFPNGNDSFCVTHVPSWHTSPGYIKANSLHIRKAIEALEPRVREDAKIIFTAHSIPLSMANESRYEAELRESAKLIAQELDRSSWDLVFQSRSGRPEDPWLEPDICDYLRTEHSNGLSAAVLCPLGFVADHIEVLYDLDFEAGNICKELGLPMSRAAAVNDAPEFLESLAETIRKTVTRYTNSHPLPLAPALPSARTEQPPPYR